MALTDFQRSVCRLIAQSRIESGESYVAGAAALNEILVAPRVSHDIDLFHDTEQALQASWQGDRTLLEARGLTVETLRERPGFVEALVSHAGERLLLQWVRDSAYRFFPLLAHRGARAGWRALRVRLSARVRSTRRRRRARARWA